MAVVSDAPLLPTTLYLDRDPRQLVEAPMESHTAGVGPGDRDNRPWVTWTETPQVTIRRLDL